MDVVGDLLARHRRSDRSALVTTDRRERSYHELLTNAYKAGNVLRYLGVHNGRTVGVEPVPDLPPVFTFLGAAQLGAVTRFAPAEAIEAGDRVVLVPADEERRYEPKPGTKLAVFGGESMRADTTNWEESVWSENPAFPPSAVSSRSAVLASSEGTVSHRTALAGAADVVDRYDLDATSRVVVRASLATEGTVIAGLLAPLLAGGTVVLTDLRSPIGDRSLGDLAVCSASTDSAPTGSESTGSESTGPVPEPATVDTSDVRPDPS